MSGGGIGSASNVEHAHNVEHPIILKTMYILTIRASQNRRTTHFIKNRLNISSLMSL